MDPLLHPRRTGGDRHLEVHPVVGVEVHRGVMTALDGEGRRPHESLVGELFWEEEWRAFWRKINGAFWEEEWSLMCFRMKNGGLLIAGEDHYRCG